jgi:ribosome-binding factor A
MPTRRTLRVARQIREIVSEVIIHELADPRLGFITVTEVDVTADLRVATVRLSVLGDKADESLCLRAIESARGRIQAEVDSKLAMKITPRLKFQLEEGVKKSIEIARLINLAKSEYRTPPEGPPDRRPSENGADGPAGATPQDEDDER